MRLRRYSGTFRVGFLLCTMLLLLLFTTTACSLEKTVPEYGVWYCDELQIQISRESAISSYICIDGEKYLCGAGNLKGTSRLRVGSQDITAPFTLGEPVFAANFIDIIDGQMVVEDDNGVRYYFKKAENVLSAAKSAYTTDFSTLAVNDEVWYCEELQLQMSLKSLVGSYMEIGGEKVFCATGWQSDKSQLCLICHDAKASFAIGEVVFSAKYVGYDNGQMVLKGDNGVEYTFEKVSVDSMKTTVSATS